MSSQRYRWWTFAKNMIRDFPMVERAWKDIHEQSITANVTGMPRGGGVGRTAEVIAMRQLPPDDQELYDAVTLARAHTLLLPNGEERMKLIRLVYWSKKKLKVKDAGELIYVSESTAKRWHKDFVRMVGRCYGFEVDTNEPK